MMRLVALAPQFAAGLRLSCGNDVDIDIDAGTFGTLCRFAGEDGWSYNVGGTLETMVAKSGALEFHHKGDDGQDVIDFTLGTKLASEATPEERRLSAKNYETLSHGRAAPKGIAAPCSPNAQWQWGSGPHEEYLRARITEGPGGLGKDVEERWATLTEKVKALGGDIAPGFSESTNRIVFIHNYKPVAGTHRTADGPVNVPAFLRAPPRTETPLPTLNVQNKFPCWKAKKTPVERESYAEPEESSEAFKASGVLFYCDYEQNSEGYFSTREQVENWNELLKRLNFMEDFQLPSDGETANITGLKTGYTYPGASKFRVTREQLEAMRRRLRGATVEGLKGAKAVTGLEPVLELLKDVPAEAEELVDDEAEKLVGDEELVDVHAEAEDVPSQADTGVKQGDYLVDAWHTKDINEGSLYRITELSELFKNPNFLARGPEAFERLLVTYLCAYETMRKSGVWSELSFEQWVDCACIWVKEPKKHRLPVVFATPNDMATILQQIPALSAAMSFKLQPQPHEGQAAGDQAAGFDLVGPLLNVVRKDKKIAGLEVKDINRRASVGGTQRHAFYSRVNFNDIQPMAATEVAWLSDRVPLTIHEL